MKEKIMEIKKKDFFLREQEEPETKPEVKVEELPPVPEPTQEPKFAVRKLTKSSNETLEEEENDNSGYL